MTNYMQHVTQFFSSSSYFFGIGATIRTRRDIQCLQDSKCNVMYIALNPTSCSHETSEEKGQQPKVKLVCLRGCRDRVSLHNKQTIGLCF